VWDLGVVVLDTPSTDIIEISSSCNLPKFSSKADSRRDKGAKVVPEGPSSASIGDLWPNTDKQDEINSGSVFIETTPTNILRNQSLMPSVVRTNKNVRPVVKRAVVDDSPGPTTIPLRGHGRGSAKKKVTWILSAAPVAILP
jgi:hypothetical protein